MYQHIPMTFAQQQTPLSNLTGQPVSTQTTGSRSEQRRTLANNAVFTRFSSNYSVVHAHIELTSVQRKVKPMPPPSLPPLGQLWEPLRLTYQLFLMLQEAATMSRQQPLSSPSQRFQKL